MHSKKLRVAVILGTRPEYLKLAPVVSELAKFRDHMHAEVVFTGQHKELLVGLSELFEIGDHKELAVNNTRPNLPGLTSALISALDGEFSREKYDAVIVQGDTTTAFCAALTAFYHRMPVAHVEAGLRTANLSEPFPEELNRQMIGRMARWNFTPTVEAHGNLTREGVAQNDIQTTGNTIIDTLMYVRKHKIPADYEAAGMAHDSPELAEALRSYRAKGGKTLALLTIHRRENHGPKLSEFFRMVRKLAKANPDHHLIYPYHLNPEVKLKAFQFMSEIPNIHLVPPLSYRPFLYLMTQVDFAMSDSGGLQEEFPTFGKPLLVLRDVTERPEVIEAKMGRLVGVDPETVFAAASELIQHARTRTQPEWFKSGPNPFGDGLASERIVARILADLQADRAAK
jgi:UDP-N-acetylglucosamine 2-epimerase (non-hydrolysing)